MAKKKLGPLPMWAWILVIGGTVGIVWYLKGKNAAATTTGDTSIIPASGAAAPVDAGAGAGTSSTDPGLEFNSTLQDIDANLAGISSQLSSLSGGQGITDTPTPTMTVAGEITDIIGTVGALQQLNKLFNPGRPPKPKPKKRKHPGSGNAGTAGHKKHKTTRRVTRHRATSTVGYVGNPAQAVRVNGPRHHKQRHRGPGWGGGGGAA